MSAGCRSGEQTLESTSEHGPEKGGSAERHGDDGVPAGRASADAGGARARADGPAQVVTQILDGVGALVAIRDASGRYVLVNSALTEFYGVAAEALLGRTPEEAGLATGFPPAAAGVDQGAKPAIARNACLVDATGRERRFEVVRRVVRSAERSLFLIEVATEHSIPPGDPLSSELAREIKSLEVQLRDVSEREQERIGHDLHDGLGQELTGVALLLKTLGDDVERDMPRLAPRVRSVRDLVDQCIATTRALAQGLSPVHLERDGFAGALEQLTVNSEALYGIPVRFENERQGARPAPDTAIDLYRIAQEAIRNAARHSGATEIGVALKLGVDELVMTVEDNGSGLPPHAEGEGGMGLKIMKYRASIVGASLDFRVREEGGTVVRCILRNAPPGG